MTTADTYKGIDSYNFFTRATPSSYVGSFNSSYSGHGTSVISSSISSSVDNVLDFLIESGISIDNLVEIKSFLTNNIGIVPHLYNFKKEIYKIFPGSELKIGIFSDYDYASSEKDIYIEIYTDLSPQDANEGISDLDRNWLISSRDLDLMSLNVVLKFK